MWTTNGNGNILSVKVCQVNARKTHDVDIDDSMTKQLEIAYRNGTQ